jgi:hypothetical protein
MHSGGGAKNRRDECHQLCSPLSFYFGFMQKLSLWIFWISLFLVALGDTLVPYFIKEAWGGSLLLCSASGIGYDRYN